MNPLLKRLHVALVLAVVLFSAIAGVQFVRLAAANFMPLPILKVYIKSDGNIEPSTVPIRRVGDVYAFTSDILNSTIEVQRDNIIIDGAGFMLQGHSGYEGIKLKDRSNVTIKNLDIRAFHTGIRTTSSSNIVVTGNKIHCVQGLDFSVHSSNNQIVGNTLIGPDASSGCGIWIWGSFNSILRNNISDFHDCINIFEDGNNTISENYIKNGTNVLLFDTKQNTLSKNNMIAGSYGVQIQAGSSSNLVFGNYITGKSGCGVRVMEAFNNIVYQNYIANNSIGIYICHQEFTTGHPNATSNTFYQNNIMDNTKNVQIEIFSTPSVNAWDNGSLGNYWSDYAGNDINDDDIGDPPYVIDENNKDNYPLMNPVVIPPIVIIPPATTPPPNDSTGQTSLNPTPLIIAVPIVLAIILGAAFYRRRVKEKSQQSGIESLRLRSVTALKG